MTRRDIFKMFAGVPAIPAVKAVESLELKKDEILVLKFKERMTIREIMYISDMMREQFPGQRFMILDGDADLKVLHHAG